MRIEIGEETELPIPEDQLSEQTALMLHRSFDDYVKVEFPSPINNKCYLLRSRSYVGCIPVNEDTTIHIRPKVPVANIFRMLEYAYNLGSFRLLDGVFDSESLEDIFERLASILARRVLDRVRKGLYRHYVKEEEPLRYVRGRVQIVNTLRAVVRGSTRLRCEYEEHTADLEDNRILAWTLARLPRMDLRRDDVRNSVRHAYRAMVGAVDIVPVDAGACIGRFYHRLNEDYRLMHSLCRFFLEHCGPGIESGEHGMIPFVLNMPSPFESFVAEWLKANLPPAVYIKPQYRTNLDEKGQFYFKIDLVLKCTKTREVLAVLDTKYKRDQSPSEQDIQQIVAYAESMQTDRAFLVYPSPATRECSASSIFLYGDNWNYRFFTGV